jgi:hypothetical protein
VAIRPFGGRIANPSYGPAALELHTSERAQFRPVQPLYPTPEVIYTAAGSNTTGRTVALARTPE